MNVSELSNLGNWVLKEITDAQIPQKYQALSSILQQNAQPNMPKNPFENQKMDLMNAISVIHFETLTKDQIRFLESINISQAIGKNGVDELEDILFKNVLDVATANQKIVDIMQKLNNGIKKLNQIKSGLEGCIFEEAVKENKEEVLIRVYFSGKASMENVVDFKNWGNAWHEIGRGIAMAHNASPEDIKIIGASRGSIIIEFSTIASIATTVGGIIWGALKVAEKVLDILKKAEEVRELKLKNDKVAKELEKEAENEKKNGEEEIAEQTIKKLDLKKDSDGDKIAALTKAINNLVDFITRGGEVDFVVPDEAANGKNPGTNESKYAELKLSSIEIKKLENKIAQIEHHKS